MYTRVQPKESQQCIPPCILPNYNAPDCFKGVEDDTFFPGRCAEVVAFGVAVGRIGVLHPETLGKFDLALPVAALEINLQHFL